MLAGWDFWCYEFGYEGVQVKVICKGVFLV